MFLDPECPTSSTSSWDASRSILSLRCCSVLARTLTWSFVDEDREVWERACSRIPSFASPARGPASRASSRPRRADYADPPVQIDGAEQTRLGWPSGHAGCASPVLVARWPEGWCPGRSGCDLSQAKLIRLLQGLPPRKRDS